MMYKRKPSSHDSRAMRWTVVWMIVLFLGVGIIAGCGTSTTMTTASRQQPQPLASAGPFHHKMQTFDRAFTITLNITPNRSGINVFQAQVITTKTGTPATHIAITLYTTMQDMPMGTDSIVLHADGNGRFSATSDALSMGGHWAIGVTIQTADHIIHKAGVSLLISL